MRLFSTAQQMKRIFLRPGWGLSQQVQLLLLQWNSLSQQPNLFSLKAWHQPSVTETAFVWVSTIAAKSSQNVHSLCTVWLYMLIVVVSPWVTFSTIADNDSLCPASSFSHLPVVSQDQAISLPFFHFLSLPSWRIHLSWLSPSLILPQTNAVRQNLSPAVLHGAGTSCKLGLLWMQSEQHVAEGTWSKIIPATSAPAILLQEIGISAKDSPCKAFDLHLFFLCAMNASWFSH